MAGLPDDKRNAVSFSINLSMQLSQGALAMLAVEGAYVAYVLGARETIWGFEFVALLSAIMLIGSVFISGKAITEVRNSGYLGVWDISVGKRKFGWQGLLLLLASLFFFISIFLSGGDKDKSLNDRLTALSSKIQYLESENKLNKEKIERLNMCIVPFGEIYRPPRF